MIRILSSLLVLTLLMPVFAAPVKDTKKITEQKLAEKKAAEKKEKVLNKVPKSLFLVKRAKIDANVGEPSIYPFEKQLRTVSDENVFKNP